jgi:hypothetical protein
MLTRGRLEGVRFGPLSVLTCRAIVSRQLRKTRNLLTQGHRIYGFAAVVGVENLNCRCVPPVFPECDLEWDSRCVGFSVMLAVNLP